MSRINLVIDPSLQSKTTAGYLPAGGAILEYNEVYSFYGVGSLKVLRGVDAGSGVDLASPIPVVAGLPYAFSVYARLPVTIPESAHARVQMVITWTNSMGTVISESTTALLDLDTDVTWYRVGGVWKAPKGATLVQVSVVHPEQGTPGTDIYLDAFLVEQANHIGGYFEELDVAKKMELVNRALSPVPQVVNQVKLGADVILNDLTLNTIDEFGTIWIVSDIEGWWGQTEPEMPDIPRGTEEGSYDVQGRATPRNLTLSGYFIPRDSGTSLTDSLDRLVTATNIIRKGGWFTANEGPNKAVWVRLSGAPEISTVNPRGKTEFSIPLRSADPVKYHWSDDDPDGFTTFDMESSDVPVKRITNYVKDPSMEYGLSSAEVWRNFVKYPNAALGTTAGWAGFTGTTLSATTSQKHSGSHGYEAVCTESLSGVASADGGVEVSGVGPHNYSVWVKAPFGAPIRAFIQEMSGTTVQASGAYTSFTGTMNWQEIRGTYNKTQAGTYLRIALQTTSNNAVTFYWDDASIVSGDRKFPYFDGSMSPQPDLTPSWTGTPGASSSILTGRLPSGVANDSRTRAYGYRSSEWSYSGRYSLATTASKNSSSGGVVTVSDVFGGATTGAKITISVKAHLKEPLPEGTIGTARALRLQLNGAGVTSPKSPSFPNTTGTHEIKWTVTLPAPPLYLELCHGHADGTIWWDDLTITRDSDTGYPFSGDTPDTPENEYYWTGTPGNSTSIHAIKPLDRLVNIGTATVTGLFTFTGPAGAGTSVTNATTDETLVLDKPLRGSGITATVEAVEATNNVATVYTTAPHDLRVGDEISFANMVLPFSGVGGTRILTAVSDIFPYSVSFAFNTDDLNKIPSSGQLYLTNNDVLVVDTYNRMVTYNGEIVGHRNRLTTLTDWVHFAPGDNVMRFYDNATESPVYRKQLVNNVATLTTTGVHYLRAGEVVRVRLAVDRTLQKKALTGNKVTLTTVGAHGYAIGDVINVNSTESAIVASKSRASNVVTLATAAAHGVSVGDQIVVSMPASMTLRIKGITSNVVTLESQVPHGFSAGDTVVVALPTSVNLSAKKASNGVATLTTSVAHGYVPGDTISVALTTVASTTSKSRSGGQVTLTTSASHGFSVGDTVEISLPASANLTGSRVFSSTNNLVTYTTSSAHGFGVGDKISINLPGGEPLEVSNRSATASSCTLTVGTHSFVAGDSIRVSGVSSRYNGTYSVTSTTSTTVTYSDPGAAEGSVASSGTATNASVANHYNGSAVVETTPSATTFTVREWDLSVNATGSATGGSVSNDTNELYNGTRTITAAPAANRFTFNL